MKHSWKPGTMIYPLPAVMVSCGSSPEEYNIITVAWVGTLCTNPPMCYISVRPERHSYPILKREMEFVINLTTEDMAYATDWCGVNSGRDHRKFEEMHLTPGRAEVVRAPIIEESPLSIECRVRTCSGPTSSPIRTGIITPWATRSANSAGRSVKRNSVP